MPELTLTMKCHNCAGAVSR